MWESNAPWLTAGPRCVCVTATEVRVAVYVGRGEGEEGDDSVTLVEWGGLKEGFAAELVFKI